MTAEDLLGDLDDFLLLEGFGDLYELAGVAFAAGVVDVSYVGHPHDDVPLQVLVEHLEGLWHVHELCQLRRVFPVRDSQQYSVVEELDAPDFEEAGCRHEAAVVVVHGVSEGIVVGIDLVSGLEQLDLVVHAVLAEYLYGFLSLDFVAVERYVLVYDLSHPFFYELYVLLGQRALVSLVEVAEIAVGDRVLHEDLAAGEYFERCFVEEEIQRPAIDSQSTCGGDVEEFDFLVVVGPVSQSLGYVVDLCGHDLEGSFEFEFVKHLLQGGSFGKLL